MDTPTTSTATATQSPPAQRIGGLLRSLYGPAAGAETARVLAERMARCTQSKGVCREARPLDERDALLITYADQVTAPAAPPLRTLAAFCEKHLSDVLSGVHLLPFYPWSSDDGFSVKDYFAVAPEYGTWEDIATFRPRFELMFDAVFNHMSAQSAWFRRFLNDDTEYRDFFVTVEGDPNLAQVVRPRALPLLTSFPGARGPLKVWTTFSEDQVDLNLKNPRALLALLDALLFYAEQGARFIRLDAIAYLWKEIGTPCIHLPQTHALIQLMRAVLDQAAPAVQLITETNVPHADNISYFGDGVNEAQLVYNFALPPLVLHALHRGDSEYLSRWASTLDAPSPRTTFFNFLASHDGIGLNPARGILPPAEIDYLVERCRAHGGFINHKHNADGTKSPYEMNIVYFDALSDPAGAEPADLPIARFLVSQAIMLSLAGVPGIYFHSIFGSRNDRAGALQSGINRRINRQKLRAADLDAELGTPGSLRSKVFAGYRKLLQARRANPCFSPRAGQTIVNADARVFALLRTATEAERWVLALHNVSRDAVEVIATPAEPESTGLDLLHGHRFDSDPSRSWKIDLGPYQIRWIEGRGSPPACAA